MMLSLAAWLDRKESQLRRVGERLGWPQAWLQEWIEYSGEPRMSLEEWWIRYTLLRMETAPRFASIKTEADALAFYRESLYMMWRNVAHRRHSAWRRVLWTMRGPRGDLLEFGCGVAPVASWVAPRRARWHYHLVDLDGPACRFACSRIAPYMLSYEPRAYWTGPYHVITAIDVFEHLPDPLAIARELVDRLAPGGYLHNNFVGNPQMNDLDLASPEQREATLAYLDSALTTVWEKDGYTVRRK